MPNILKLAKLNGEAEIFHTLQGEGVSMGVPVVFIRLSLCNLHCTWCDTDYTWNWQGTPWTHDNDETPGYEKFNKSEYQMELSIEEAAEAILAYDCPRLVITGGEPLLQQEAVLALINHLKSQVPNFTFEIETNGTQEPSAECIDLVTQFNVSPKLKNSGNIEKLRITPSALKTLSATPHAWFKFVIKDVSDLHEVRELINTFQIPKSKVLLMPEGRTPEELMQKRLWLADICRDGGYRFSDRLHVQLWGAKRGV